MSTAVHEAPSAEVRATGSWPLERVLFLLAGVMVSLSAILAAAVSPWFLLLTGFVGINLLLFATFRVCGASLILTRVFKLQSRLEAR